MSEDKSLPVLAEVADRPRRAVGCVGAVLTIGLLLLVGCAGAVYFSLRGASLVASKETTYITGPLKSDGKQVDYFAAWEQEISPEGMATDRNGYRLIVQHLGASPGAAPEHFTQICEKLGLDPDSVAPDRKLEDPYDYLKRYVESDRFDATRIEALSGKEPAEATSAIDVLTSRIGRAWTLDDLPMMEAWLAENTPAIDLISQAVERPVFHIPHVRSSEDDMLLSILLLDVQYARSFARALSARAHYRIGTGDIDGAIDDVVACKRLGRHIGHDGMLIEMLVGIAIEGIADGIGIAGSLENPPTKEQLKRLMDELDGLPPGSDVNKSLRFERYASLDVIQAMAFGNRSLAELDIPTQVPRFGFDWNVIARRINVHYDAMMAKGAVPKASFGPMAVVSTQARSEMLADVLGALLLPAVDAAKEAARRSLCVERVRRISLAMLRYEADHGVLPPMATAGADGNRLQSWRVDLLPYLGERELYDRIHHDEPWDSQHNAKFHKQAPACYQCPSAHLPLGETTYSVVVGPDMPFGVAGGKPLADFGPKSASMILVVESTQGVCWMDPSRDIPQDTADAGINAGGGRRGGISSHHPGGANFGLRHGGCQFLSETIDAETFRALLRGESEGIEK